MKKKTKFKRNTIIRTRSKVHKINMIFKKLKKEHFNGENSISPRTKITWGKYGAKKVHRKTDIVFGTYSADERLIRIHPALDSILVPESFIEHVIHHEMLHEILPPIPGSGSKMQIHHKKFRDAEKKTPSYKEAMKWEKKESKIFFAKNGVKQKR
jgi:hypothetical protein